MKTTTPKILFFLLFLTNVVTAQVITVTDYFDKNGKTKDTKNSLYYRVGNKTLMKREDGLSKWDSVFVDTVFTYYTQSNTMRSRVVYDEGEMNGSYTFYHENKKIKEKGTYKNNLKVGYVTEWTDKGAVKQTLQYFPVYGWKPGEQDSFKIINYWDEAGKQLVKDGSGYCKCSFGAEQPVEEGKVIAGYRDSVWTITSGDSLISYEHFNAGKLLKGESIYKGARYTYKAKFVMSEFKGGYQGIAQFLRQNIKYPSNARRMGKQGKVYVKFIIDAEGNVSGLDVLKGASYDLDEEAVRVIRISNGRWIAGKFRGLPVESSFVLPVSFKLQ